MAKKEYPFDPDDEERMLAIHKGLIDLMVGRFIYSGASEDDLRQVASIGLIMAVRRFDETKKVKFSSFAVPIMRTEILNYLHNFFWQYLKVPGNVMLVVQKILRQLDGIKQKYDGRTPTLEELASLWNIPVEQLKGAFEVMINLFRLSLNQEIAEGYCLEDTLSDTSKEGELVDLQIDIRRALGRIPSGHAHILLDLAQGKTLEDIAQEQGCSIANIQFKSATARRRLALELPGYDKVIF